MSRCCTTHQELFSYFLKFCEYIRAWFLTSHLYGTIVRSWSCFLLRPLSHFIREKQLYTPNVFANVCLEYRSGRKFAWFFFFYFPQLWQAHFWIVLKSRLCPHHSTSFPIYFSIMTLPFGAMQSELQNASLNKPQTQEYCYYSLLACSFTILVSCQAKSSKSLSTKLLLIIKAPWCNNLFSVFLQPVVGLSRLTVEVSRSHN